MKNKRNQRMKRGLAWVLSIAMFLPLLSNAIVAQAEEEYQENNAYVLDEMKAELLESEEALAITEPTLTFPASAAIVNVGTELVFHLFRQGSTEKKETVTLATYDSTAGYGEDYEILVDGNAIDGKANKILDGTGVVYNVYMGENVLSDNTSDEATETSESEALESENEEIEAYVGEQAESLKDMTSSTFEITFEAGEAYKELRIRGFVPEKATGNKDFQLFIMECEEGTTVGTNSSVVVTLQDNREAEEAKIEILEDTVEVVDGYVTVMVERSGNTENYATYTLTSQNKTAENGADFVLNAAQLTFTPGVTKQRIHIPLVASDVSEEKSFVLRADDDEEVITYTSTDRGATFKQSREMIDIPLSEFQIAGVNADDVEFSPNSDGDCYDFSFHTKMGDADNCTASIRTASTYDFTGIDTIRLSASYQVGTIMGDFLNVYASNTDYYNNLNALATLSSNNYGKRITTVSLTGQGIHNVSVNRIGDYYLYMTIQQHDCFGWVGYNLYNQEFDGGDEGHVALIKKAYTLELVNPTNITSGGTTSAPAGNLSFTLLSDGSVKGKTISSVYRDDSFQFSYTKIYDDVVFKGYQLLDDSDNVVYTKWTDSTVFCLNSEVLKYVEKKGISKVRIRPMFERPDVVFTVKAQDFESMGLTDFTASIDKEKKEIVYYENDVEVMTVTWSQSSYKKGDTLTFWVHENDSYNGEYQFDSLRERSSNLEDFRDTNPAYHMDKNWSTVLTHDYTEIVPMVSCFNAPFYINVTNATHGTFIGKPENLTTDDYVVKDLDGIYETTDIVTLYAKPDSGYQAKWTYKDTTSGNMVTYYGNYFYYQMQFPLTSNDNYIYLDFEKVTEEAKEYQITATVYMQGGDILHEPDPDSTDYFPLENAHVSINGETRTTAENGSTGEKLFTVNGHGGEKHRALVMANNQSYIYEFEMPSSNASSIQEEIKLSYYYEGPRVSGIRYYDHTGTKQSGDTIYLEDQMDTVIISASIEENDKEVTHVMYVLTDSEGNPKMDAVEAELNGSEYIWSVALGNYATEGDQIWIYLQNRQTDENGNMTQTSYGKYNTGYSIVMAEYKDVSYLPDTGNVSATVPIWGNMFFNFNVKGVKPVMTTSRSGNLMFMTIGVSPNFAYSPSANRFVVPDWQSYKQNKNAGLQYLSKAGAAFVNESEELLGQLNAAQQVMKKNVVSFNFPITYTMVMYTGTDSDSLFSEMYLVAGYFSFGFNTTYLFSYPFLLEGIPMFANIQISGAVSDTVQLQDRTDTGLVTVNMLSDPTKVAYKGANDMNLKVDVMVSLGVGVNSVLSLSGGGTGTFSLDWVDFTYGKGSLSFAASVRVEVLCIGRTFSQSLASYEIFNKNPYTTATASVSTQELDMEDVLDTKLSTFKLKNFSSYNQSISDSLSSGTWVNDAYEFSKPEIVSMGNNRYLVVATVDSSHVNGYEDEEQTAVMSYAIYNANTQSFEREEGKKIFTSLEPTNSETGRAINAGDSLNFNPSVTVIDGGYAIVWNSLMYDAETNPENLTLDKMRTVIKSAVVKDPDVSASSIVPVYKSIVVVNESDKIMPSLVTETVYDADNKEVLLLYRTLDFSTLNQDSTLGDYGKVGTTLSVTSLNVSDTALADTENAWTDSVVVASNDTSSSVIKNADIAIMDDNGTKVPVIAYHVAQGKYASLLYEAENTIYEDGDTTNHIYVESLAKSDNGYTINKSAELPIDTSKYQANPKLANGPERAMLMWKQANRIAAADPIDVLNGTYENNNYKLTGLATINDETVGNSGDFQLIEGDDNKLYCLWMDTDSCDDGSSGNSVKMSVLETCDDGYYWTEAKEIFHTSNNQYVQSLSATVDENGNLRTLYRQTDLSTENGESQIQMETQENLSVTLLQDETEDVEEMNVRDSVYASPELKITDLHFVANNITDGTNADTYTVKATITNSGEAEAEESEIVVSYLENKNNDDGEATVYETTLGQTTVPALDIGESANVTFEISVDQSFYANKHFGVAPLGIALYEYYGEEDQNMVDRMLDGVVAKTEEEATDLEVTAPKSVAVNKKTALQTRVYPVTAQQYENLTFTTSNSKIAKIDENGVLTGVSTGECTVTVTSASGIEKTVPITVTKDDVDDDSNDNNNSDNGNDNNGNNNNSNNNNGNGGSGTNANGQNGSNSNVTTGDTSISPTILIVICLASAAMIVGIIIYKQKNKKK